MAIVSVNYMAVVVSGVAAMIIGMVWYSQTLFGPMWLKLSGISKKKAEKMHKKNMAPTVTVGLISMIVIAWVLAMMLQWTGLAGATGGLLLGFWVWLGFVAPLMLGSVLWERKPIALYILNTAHWLVVLIVMAAILGAWV